MNKIRELRKKAGLTLNQLSKELKKSENISITPDAIAKYERGDREPKLETWEKLARFFNVSLSYLSDTEDSFEDKKQIVINIILKAYTLEDFGYYRINDIIMEQLPDSDAISDLLENNALESDNFDLSYELENYIKTFYPDKFEVLSKKYETFEHNLEIEHDELNISDLVNQIPNSHNDEIEKNLEHSEDEFNKYFRDTINVFIDDLTNYLIEKKTPDLIRKGVQSNVAILYITDWFSTQIFKAKKDKNKGIEKNEIIDIDKMLNDIQFNKIFSIRDNVNHLYNYEDSFKVSITKEEIKRNIKILINDINNELNDVDDYINKHS